MSGLAPSDPAKSRSANGYALDDGRVLVAVDPRYFRPTEVNLLIGDSGKARQKPGWRHETSVRERAREMVAADMAVMCDAPSSKEV